MKKLFNAPNLLGAVAFLALICAAGFEEGGNHAGAVTALIVTSASAWLSMKEDGQIKK